jgi:RNA polymerase sigma-70 factor (ECF subfamily)
MSSRKVFHSLILAKADAVRSYLRRRVPEYQAVPELAQEVFVRLLQASESRPVANPEAYLWTLAANLVREHAATARANSSRRVVLSDAIVAEALTDERSADAEVARSQLVSRLREALRELSPTTLAVIRMAYEEELSYREIARSLGLSKSAVQRILTKALGRCYRHVVGQGWEKKT